MRSDPIYIDELKYIRARIMDQNSSDAIQYLKSLQRNLVNKYNKFFTNDYFKATNDLEEKGILSYYKKYAKSFEAINKNINNLPYFLSELKKIPRVGPFENRLLTIYSLKEALEIENAARMLNLSIPNPPIIGNLPIGSLNAMKLPVPNNKQELVVIEKGLLFILTQFILTLSEYLEIKSAGDNGYEIFAPADSDVTKDKKCFGYMSIKEGLCVYMHLLFVEGHFMMPDYVSQTMPTARTFFCDDLVRHCLLFTVAHEYGHIIHSTDKEIYKEWHHIFKNIDEAYTKDQISELVADQTALNLMTHIFQVKGYDLFLIVLSLDLLFGTMLFLERTLSTLMIGDPLLFEDGTPEYPSTQIRRSMLFHRLISSFPEYMNSFEFALEIGRCFENIRNDIFNNCFGYLQGLHNDKIKLAPFWYKDWWYI